jgi:hypothetical protein
MALFIILTFFFFNSKQLPNDGKNILTYASYVVGYSELREEQKTKEYFNRMNNHFNGPFQVRNNVH